jgi:hypothetical protein
MTYVIILLLVEVVLIFALWKWLNRRRPVDEAPGDNSSDGEYHHGVPDLGLRRTGTPLLSIFSIRWYTGVNGPLPLPT